MSTKIASQTTRSFSLREVFLLIVIVSILSAWKVDRDRLNAACIESSRVSKELELRHSLQEGMPRARREAIKSLVDSKDRFSTVSLIYAMTDPDQICRQIATDEITRRGIIYDEKLLELHE